MDRRRKQLAEKKIRNLEWIWAGHRNEVVGLPDLNSELDIRPGFVDWLLSDQPLFWISGKPASGKSSLMKYLSESRLCPALLNSFRDSTWLIAYFYFNYRERKNVANDLEGMMRALLSQLMRKSPELGAFITDIYVSKFGEPKFDAVSYVDLYELFSEACSSLSIPICLFLDGLDEFEGNLRVLVECVQDLAVLPNLKICMASRPEPALSNGFRHIPNITMEDFNSHTIRGYTENALTSYAEYLADRGSQLVLNLVEQVVKRSEGVILWTEFICQELSTGMLAWESIDELTIRLETYPSDLDAIYQRLIDKTDQRFRAEVVTMLYAIETTMIYSFENLHILFLWFRRKGYLESYPSEILDMTSFVNRVRARLGNLVDIRMGRSRWVAELIHKSLSTFLEKSKVYQEHLLPYLYNRRLQDRDQERELLWSAILLEDDTFDVLGICEAVNLLAAKCPDIADQNHEELANLYCQVGELGGFPKKECDVRLAILKVAFEECGEFDNNVYDRQTQDLCEKRLQKDIYCFHYICRIWKGCSLRWSVREWITIIHLVPQERALIFSLERIRFHSLSTGGHEFFNGLDLGREALTKCLLVVHGLFHHAWWKKDEVLDKHAAEVEELLFAKIPENEAELWSHANKAVQKTDPDIKKCQCSIVAAHRVHQTGGPPLSPLIVHNEW